VSYNQTANLRSSRDFC